MRAKLSPFDRLYLGLEKLRPHALDVRTGAAASAPTGGELAVVLATAPAARVSDQLREWGWRFHAAPDEETGLLVWSFSL